MGHKLCLIVCNYFLPEVNQIIKSGGYTDIVIKGFHSSCTKASLPSEKIKEIIGENSSLYSKVMIIGSSCFVGNKEKTEDNNQTEFIKLDQCFEILASKSLLDHLISKKCYLVSNGWLKDYKRHINDWGFDRITAKKFFNESTEKIVLLETGLKGDYLPQLEAISDYMGLPYEILPVGLSYCKLFLDSIIFQWREESERNSIKEKLTSAFTRAADYALAFNQLNNLIDFVDEKEIVRKIFDFLNVLFLPINIAYTPSNNKLKLSPIYFKQESSHIFKLTDKSFNVELWNQKELIGVFDIIEVALPQYIDKYKEVSQIIGSFGGLAIANARKFMTIKNDEKLMREMNEELSLSKDMIEENLFQKNMLVDELTATKEKLEKINTEKDKFFSIIAHDFKSPFMGFIGLTEIMSEDIHSFSEAELSKLMQEMHSNAKNLFKLLENLLEWARMQQGAVDFNPIALLLSEEVSQNIDLLIKRGEQKGIEIVLEVPEKQTVYADEAMLNSILRNLLSNAVKFTKQGGKVIVHAKETENNTVEISVSDSGVGMSAELCSKLFKIEEKVGRKGTEGENSTGLGLLLCKEFVEKHGGKIWVESKEDVGSTFYFTLPHNPPN